MAARNGIISYDGFGWSYHADDVGLPKLKLTSKLPEASWQF